MGFCVPGDKTF